MTENEAIERCEKLLNGLSVNHSVNRAFAENDKIYPAYRVMVDFANTCKKALEEIQQYRAIGTVEEIKVLKEKETEILLKDGQFLYQQGLVDGYANAIDEFAEKLKERLKGMQMVELQGEDVCPCAETGEACPYMNQDIGCQYCAREQTIKELDEIAEQLKEGVKNDN